MKLNTPYTGSVLTGAINERPFKVDTISDLNSLSGMIDKDSVIVTDKTRGGIFIYRTSLVGIDDGGIVINGWERQYSGSAYVEWFGADDIDIVGDSTTAIKACIKAVAGFERAEDYNTNHRIPYGGADSIGVGRNRSVAMQNKVYGVSDTIYMYTDTILEGNGATLKWVGGISSGSVFNIHYNVEGGTLAQYGTRFTNISNLNIDAMNKVANGLKCTNLFKGVISAVNVVQTTSYGVRLEETQYITFTNLTVSRCKYGLMLGERPNVTSIVTRTIDNSFINTAINRCEVGVHLASAISNQFLRLDVSRNTQVDILLDLYDKQSGETCASIIASNKFLFTKHEHISGDQPSIAAIVVKSTVSTPYSMYNNSFTDSSFSHQGTPLVYYKWFMNDAVNTTLINPVMGYNHDAFPVNPDVANDYSMFIVKGGNLNIHFGGWRPDADRVDKIAVLSGTENNNPPTYVTDSKCNVTVESDYRYHSAP